MQDFLCFWGAFEGLGRKIEDNEKVSKMLWSLRPKWMTKRIVLEEMRPKELNELVGSLKVHEIAKKQAKRAR